MTDIPTMMAEANAERRRARLARALDRLAAGLLLLAICGLFATLIAGRVL